jgi:regulator of protease activity HflC (stomatin/prohibitin superfamily)
MDMTKDGKPAFKSALGALNAPASITGGAPGGGGFGSVVRWTIGLVAVGFLAITLSVSPFFTVDQGEVGVVLRFGKVNSVAQPGLNFKLPFVDSVVRMSTRTEKRVYDNLQSYSADVQEAAIRVTVNHRVPASGAADVYARFGETYVQRLVDPMVPKRLKEVFGQYQATTVVAERSRLGLEVENAIKESVPPEIVIESVQIENIDFSDAYEAAIEAAAQAEAEVRKSRNQLEREKIEAEKRVVQARASAEAVRQAAQAESEAIRLRGEAEAATIAAKAKAFTDNPGYVNLIAAEKWDGKLPTTQVPGSALPFVEIPNGSGATSAKR